MNIIKTQIDCLEGFPAILKNLLSQIPKKMYKQRRISNKWSILEQVHHLIEAQDILIGRFRQFEFENLPHIQSYEPKINKAKDFQTDHGMKLLTEKFLLKRKELINMLRGYDAGYWEKTGTHDVFKPYSAQILLTHTLNVDYAHLINIEKLGLTRDDFENENITNT